MNFRQQSDFEEAAAQSNNAYKALYTYTGTSWKTLNGNQRHFMTYFTILPVLHYTIIAVMLDIYQHSPVLSQCGSLGQNLAPVEPNLAKCRASGLSG
jgi:hypothetical protein